jgi:hypothetical protein
MGRKNPLVLLPIVGLAAVLVYLGAATGVLKGADNLTLALVFAIGPVAILGVLSVSRRLAPQGGSLTLRAGTVFLIVGFSLFTLMLVVQQTIFIHFREFRAGAANEAAQDALALVFKGVNLVQLGADVAFDIFYCLGMILLAAVMFRHPDFGKVFGILGIVSAAALLAFNLYAFPYLPAKSGLVDLGPLTGLWWLAVIVQFLRLERKARGGVKPDREVFG